MHLHALGPRGVDGVTDRGTASLSSSQRFQKNLEGFRTL